LNELTYGSGFSGIGGFDLGLERVGGFKRVWSCDNNKYANKIYTKHFGKENHHSGDIKRVNTEDIPHIDLFCAGFPCQAFSIAGKRKGFQDTRGTLFYEICRIAEAKRPPLLLLENVKGLLNHDRGRTFTIILQSLDELGYWLEWQVLNSKYFGVPQNRERVFIVGHLRGGSTRPIFPLREAFENSVEACREKQDCDDMISGTLTANYDSKFNDTYLAVIPGVSNSVDTSGWLRQMGRHEEEKHGLTDYRIRRLTPIECERLQGFPDGWTEGISDIQRYKCLENAVTVNVIEFLGKLIKSQFTNKEGSK